MDAAHRMGTVKNGERPIIIKFISWLDKDTFLKRRKTRSNLRAVDLGYVSEFNIYVNEFLTPSNRLLLQKTREAAKRKGYQFEWTLNCTIFARKASNDKTMKILCEAGLDKL